MLQKRLRLDSDAEMNSMLRKVHAGVDSDSDSNSSISSSGSIKQDKNKSKSEKLGKKEKKSEEI